MDKLLELAERCEAATGPDRELAEEALLASGWCKTQIGHFLGPLYWWTPPGGLRRGSGFKDDDFHHHNPLTSLDAAMTLVPEGADFRCGSANYGGFARIDAIELGEEYTRAATPALALCAAALRARAAQPIPGEQPSREKGDG